MYWLRPLRQLGFLPESETERVGALSWKLPLSATVVVPPPSFLSFLFGFISGCLVLTANFVHHLGMRFMNIVLGVSSIKMAPIATPIFRLLL